MSLRRYTVLCTDYSRLSSIGTLVEKEEGGAVEHTSYLMLTLHNPTNSAG